MVGVAVGICIVPRDQIKTAALVLWLIALLMPLVFFTKGARSGTIALIGAVLAGFIVFSSVRLVLRHVARLPTRQDLR
jgi:hypothetical protein